ncbi:MAG: hypothetical protein U0805_10845 [Pirellulales bacterium]
MNTTILLRLSRHFGAALLALTICSATTTSATPISVTIEPDSYADSQILNTISPYVTLSTGVPPANAPTFDVVADTDPTGASTGTKVFAHAGGIPFWNTSRTLRMDFVVPATTISLDYIASGFMSNSYTGRLDAFSSTGTLLDSYETALLAAGQFETMTVTAPHIAYAIAHPPSDPFGNFDHLTFTAVPEPTWLVTLLIALSATLFTRRHRIT